MTHLAGDLPKPEGFRLGSLESRAAARAMIERRRKSALRISFDFGNAAGITRSYRTVSDGTEFEIVFQGEIE